MGDSRDGCCSQRSPSLPIMQRGLSVARACPARNETQISAGAVHIRVHSHGLRNFKPGSKLEKHRSGTEITWSQFCPQ